MALMPRRRPRPAAPTRHPERRPGESEGTADRDAARLRRRQKAAWVLIGSHAAMHVLNSAFLVVCIAFGQYRWASLAVYALLWMAVTALCALVTLKVPRERLPWTRCVMLTICVGTCASFFSGQDLASAPARSAYSVFVLMAMFAGLVWLRASHLLQIGVVMAVLQVAQWVVIRSWYPERASPSDLISALVCLAAGVQLSYLGGRVFVLNERLRQRTSELDAAVVAIERLARTDELTGCMNRRHLLHSLDAAVGRLHAGEVTSLAVLLLDLDHFKRINDEFGHPAGDTVLQRFAARVAAVLPPGAVFGRQGGEEFIVAACGLERAALLQMAESVRAAVAGIDFADVDPRLAATCSIGVAVAQPEDAADDLLAAADQALYLAKRRGRNRVELRDRPPSWRLPTASPEASAGAVRIFARPLGEATMPMGLESPA